MLGTEILLSRSSQTHQIPMKNWLTPFVAAAFAITALASCEKDEDQVTVAPSATPTLTASRTSAVLVQANGDQTALTYTWTPASFALSGTEYSKLPAITYQLQFAKSADGFGYPGIVDAGTGVSRAVTVKELNSALSVLGLAPGAAVPLFARVVAVLGTDAQAFPSNTLPITVTTYKECLPPNSDTWGLVGPAGNGWPDNPPAVQSDLTMTWDCDVKAYVVRTALKAGPFKFRKDKAWDVNLGGPAGNLAQGIALSPNGSDLTIATAGTYTVKLEVTGSGKNVTAGKVTVTQ